MPSVLIVCTSHTKLGDTDTPTGAWLEEIAAPYYLFTGAGCKVDIASPAGGAVPLDPGSLAEPFFTPDAQRFKEDAVAWGSLQTSLPLSTVSGLLYDAVFVAGGHGIMYDGADPHMSRVIELAFASGKVVAAVCHGPAALVGVNDADGNRLVAGKKVTGFSNSEEAAVGKTEVVPYLLQDKLAEQGGMYDAGPDWGEFAVVDGRLVTGQNPQSSAACAKSVLALLQ